MTYLLDSSVLIDTLNGRNGRPQLLAQFSQQNILLAGCAVSVTKLYMGMRSGEETKTGTYLRSLEFYPVKWESAQRAGELFGQWRQKDQTLRLADVTIAAVAITQLTLVTGIWKHFPMPELRLTPLPPPE